MRLESAHVAGHTLKLIVLDPAPDCPRPSLEDVRAAVGSRLDAVPVLRQQLAPTPLRLGPPAWVDDDRFDLAHHVRRIELDAPVSADGLREIAAAAMRERLDARGPYGRSTSSTHWPTVAWLWCGSSTTRSRTGRRRCGSPTGSCGRPSPSQGFRRQGRAAGARPPPLVARTCCAPPPSIACGPSAPAWRRWGDRPPLRGRLRDFGRLAGAMARDLRPVADRSPLDAPISQRRAVAFASAPLDLLHSIEKAHGDGVTVNDVVLAVVGGALRRWLRDRHGPLPEMRVRIPVSLHDPSAQDAAANRDSFMCLTLPLDEPDPVHRLLAVNPQTRARKRHNDPQVFDTFLRDLGHGSSALRRLAERMATAPRVFGLSVSNVPGPRDRMYVAGCPVRSLSSLSEIGEHHALRVAAISYAGTVTFGLCADPAAVDGVERMAAAIEDEVDHLRGASGPAD